nr:uncharacterized protein LOC116769742 [Danaus plexippus plexippus]
MYHTCHIADIADSISSQEIEEKNSPIGQCSIKLSKRNLQKAEDKQSTHGWQLVDDGDLSRTDVSHRLNRSHLQVITKHEIPSDRPAIPATFMEKLSFFRAYTSTLSKLELLCEQQNSVQRFLWFYVFNVLCKSLPMTYIYLFLSIYSPDQHLFLPKMAPLLYGYNFIFLVTSFFGLALMLQGVSFYIAYFVFGIIDKIPWNRCDIKEHFYYGYNYSCLDLLQFTQKISTNDEVIYDEYRQLYKIGKREYFTLAQIDYFDRFIDSYDERLDWNKKEILLVIIFFLWTSAACLRNHISKRYTWKILHRAQLALCGVYVLSFIHLIITYTDGPINYIEHDLNNILMLADFDLLAESMTAPPVAHIIFSRSGDKVDPSLDSALINLSNSVFYISRAVTSYLCKKYGENWVNASIIYISYGSTSMFFTWPIYFSTLYGGELYVLLFLALNAVVDYFTCLITFQCLIQTFITEWEKIKPWCASCIILAAGLAGYFTNFLFIEFGFIFWTCLSTLSETIIIFWLYPMGRLVDDITFHFGVPPTRLRIWSLFVLPIFYSIKCYILIDTYLKMEFYEEMVNYKMWTFIIQSLVILFGAIYIFFYYIHKKKQRILSLLTPVAEWGPRSYNLRQLRRKFDSRKYVRSQAPRDLSRNLIEKTEKTSYKLDIIYEERKRRVTFEEVK